MTVTIKSKEGSFVDQDDAEKFDSLHNTVQASARNHEKSFQNKMASAAYLIQSGSMNPKMQSFTVATETQSNQNKSMQSSKIANT